jgi:NAD(P)-dependent dehydrogenase (short-subunit alcohol dehydrogenase family)
MNAPPDPARRRVLITGCSGGIGAHAARRLHERGWFVVAACRAEDDCRRLREAGIASVRLDYRDTAGIARAFAEASALCGGRIDAVVNNGGYLLPGAVEDLPAAALRDILETNVVGWHELTRLAVAQMRRQGGGRIVQLSSVLAFVTLRFRGAYAASKHATAALTDTLRQELHGSGIHAVLIEPGLIGTGLRRNAAAQFDRWIDVEASPWRDRYRATLIPRLHAEAPPPSRFEAGCDATTAAITRALEARRPRARYRVTVLTHGFAALRRMLPAPLMEAILRRL